MCLCQTKYQGGVSHHFGGVTTSLKKYRAIWGIAAIVSRDNFCLSAAAQLPSPRGQFGKRRNCPLLWGRGNLGGILRGNFGEGNCESKIARETIGSQNFCLARHQDVSQGPLGIGPNKPEFHSTSVVQALPWG